MSNVLAEKAVLSSLSLSRWTARKFDKKTTADIHRKHGVSAKAGRYTKALIDRGSMQEIERVASEARVYHYEHTLPWTDQGARILPSALYLDYTKEMRRLRHAFEAAADAFAKDYPAAVEQARKDLNGLFNAADYPAPNRIRRHFEFDVGIMPCPTTNAKDFRIALADEQAEEVRKEVEARMTHAARDTLSDVAKRLHDVVGHMSERLHKYKPATKTRSPKNTFHDTLVDNVRDLSKLLDAFNITGDTALTTIARRVERDLCVHDASVLRDDKAVRKSVAQQADAILTTISDFMA